MKTIKSYIIDELEKELRLMKRDMTKNKRALCSPIPVAFTVELWRDDAWKGCVMVSTSKSNEIEKAFSGAIKECKDKKKKYDVAYVVAHLKNGKNVELPKKYWEHLGK